MCSLSHGRNFNRRNSNYGENLEMRFLSSMDGKEVTVIMINGYQLKGYINEVDEETILITTLQSRFPGVEKQCMVYKNAISTIMPSEKV